MPTPASFTPPSSDQYVAAFRAVRGMTDTHVQMLRAHYHAPERTVTAGQLAQAVGYSSYSVANAQYGRLARLLGEQLDYNPEPERLGSLVRFEKRANEWHWLMRPEVAQALDILRWVDSIVLLHHQFERGFIAKFSRPSRMCSRTVSIPSAKKIISNLEGLATTLISDDKIVESRACLPTPAHLNVVEIF